VANVDNPAANCAVFRVLHVNLSLVIAGSAALVASFNQSCCLIVTVAPRLKSMEFFQQEVINAF
jgi:hypothetical protein